MHKARIKYSCLHITHYTYNMRYGIILVWLCTIFGRLLLKYVLNTMQFLVWRKCIFRWRIRFVYVPSTRGETLNQWCKEHQQRTIKNKKEKKNEKRKEEEIRRNSNLSECNMMNTFNIK